MKKKKITYKIVTELCVLWDKRKCHYKVKISSNIAEDTNALLQKRCVS